MQRYVGAWLSLVERTVRDREVGGSNPLAPTKILNKKATRCEWLCHLCRRLCQTEPACFVESEISVVKTLEVQKAEEFLDALRPRGDHFKNFHVGGFPKPTEQHVFRGHEDDRFELVPKALRIGPPPVKLKSRGVWGSIQPNPDAENKEEFVDHPHGMVTTGNWKNRDQVSAEVLMLTDFFRFADESGLPLPEDSRKFRASVLDPFLNHLSAVKRDEEIRKWPPSEMLSLMGLAQHYGVPTRLLDWTRSAYTAAYFAARSAVVSRDVTVSHLSVWAFNIEAYNVRRNCATLRKQRQRICKDSYRAHSQ